MRNDGMSLKEKQKKIRAANEKFIKKHKLEKNEVVKIGILSENQDIGVIKTIKTGNIAIDILTGGLVQGQAVVWYGGPAVGKSTQVRNMVAYTQKEYDAFHSYLNQEKSMDRTYWETAGVDLGALEVAEFETTEQALDNCMECAKGEKPVDILTIDTLQALSPEGELRKGSGGEKSIADNTIALLPRLYSQYFRMHTSMNTGLSLLLISQVRTNLSSNNAFEGMTGGVAIRHYAFTILQMKRSESVSAWPYSVAKIPDNSFVVNYKIDKIKGLGRYKGLTLSGYFVNGCFDRRFNIIAIGKQVGVHDGKSFTYPNPEKPDEQITYTCRGLNEMINGVKCLPNDAVEYMYTLLEPAFLEMVGSGIATIEEVEDVNTAVNDDGEVVEC